MASGSEPRGVSAQRGAESAFVVANGRSVHCLDYGGEGPDLVLIPGITMPAATWNFVSVRLSPMFRVVAVDLPGRGLSDPGRPGSHSARHYARDLVALIDVLDLRLPVLLGHSLGARVSAAVAVGHPGLAGHVVLADPPLCGPDEPPYATPLADFLADIVSARGPNASEYVRMRHPTWSDEQIAARAEWLPTCDEEAIVEDYDNFGKEDFFGMWRRVSPPATLVYGCKSPMYTGEAVDRLRRENPAVTIVGVEGAGHMIPFDNLPGFLEVLAPLACGPVSPGDARS